MNIKWGMPHEVQWATQTGELDDYARPVYKPMGTISARVNRKVQIVKNSDGADVVSDTLVHVIDPVLVGDKITVNGNERKVVSVDDGQPLYGAKASFCVLYL